MAKEKDFYFIKKWKKENANKIKLVHPEYTNEMIDDYLEKVIEKNLKNPECQVRNTYRGVKVQTNLLDIIEFIQLKKPILGGYGVMYKNQNDVYNPSAHMLTDSINIRKRLKSERKKYDKRSYEFLMLDIGQGNEKVIANSFYGANGNKTSTFYNRDIASSITSIGQAEISTAETSFEAFMGNNTPFFDIDECLLFIYRIVRDKKYKYDIEPIENAHKRTFERLLNTFNKPNYNSALIKKVLDNLTDEECTKIYFTNNILEFLEYYKPAKKLLAKVVNKTKTFRDPNNVPEEIVGDLEQLWEYIKCFVAYDYTVRNRIERDKYMKRKVCVTQDTDSTMTTLGSIYDFIVEKIADEEVEAESEDEFEFIVINSVCYILTMYSKLFLGRYTSDVNILEDYQHMINMKNEFYYPILFDTSNKKNYITLTKLQEGVEIKPPKIEIHGLSLTKSETPEITKDFFSGIIKNNIFYTDTIDPALIMRKTQQFKNTIRQSLENQETAYLSLKSVKEVEAYDTPFSEMGIKAVRMWNFLYPDMQVNLPDKILVLPLICKTLKKYEANAHLIPQKWYNLIKEKTFDSSEKSLRTAGFSIIAIPQNVEKIPEWLIPLIDYDKVIDDNVGKFNPILKSLGLTGMDTRSNEEHITNLVSF